MAIFTLSIEKRDAFTKAPQRLSKKAQTVKKSIFTTRLHLSGEVDFAEGKRRRGSFTNTHQNSPLKTQVFSRDFFF